MGTINLNFCHGPILSVLVYKFNVQIIIRSGVRPNIVTLGSLVRAWLNSFGVGALTLYQDLKISTAWDVVKVTGTPPGHFNKLVT